MARPDAIVDATVIINLARVQMADKLCKLYSILLPSSVARESRLGGRRRRRRDVVRLRERARPCKRWDKTVFAAALVRFRREDPARAHTGEAEMIAQAALRGVRVVLTDDRSATVFARERGLEVLGTPRLLRLIAEAEA